MAEKFWNCWVEGTDGGFHYRHSSLEVAKQEAERLARMPSINHRKVYVLELVAYCEVPEIPVDWHLV